MFPTHPLIGQQANWTNLIRRGWKKSIWKYGPFDLKCQAIFFYFFLFGNDFHFDPLNFNFDPSDFNFDPFSAPFPILVFLWFPFRSINNVMWFIFNNLNRICVILCTWMYGFLNIHVQRCSKMHKFFLVEQNEYWLTPNWLKSVQIKPQILFFVIQTVNAFDRKVHSKENHKKGSSTSWRKE